MRESIELTHHMSYVRGSLFQPKTGDVARGSPWKVAKKSLVVFKESDTNAQPLNEKLKRWILGSSMSLCIAFRQSPLKIEIRRIAKKAVKEEKLNNKLFIENRKQIRP